MHLSSLLAMLTLAFSARAQTPLPSPPTVGPINAAAVNSALPPPPSLPAPTNFTSTVFPPANATTTTYNITVPANSGNGTCSPTPVNMLSYTLVTPLPPHLLAVLACNRASYDALLPANLSDPSTSALPPPLLDLSCFPDQGRTNISACTRVFPQNRKLRAQEMCVLLKNGGADPVTVTVVVAWGADNGSAANATNSTGNSTSAAMATATRGVAMTVGVVSLVSVVGSGWL